MQPHSIAALAATTYLLKSNQLWIAPDATRAVRNLFFQTEIRTPSRLKAKIHQVQITDRLPKRGEIHYRIGKDFACFLKVSIQSAGAGHQIHLYSHNHTGKSEKFTVTSSSVRSEDYLAMSKLNQAERLFQCQRGTPSDDGKKVELTYNCTNLLDRSTFQVSYTSQLYYAPDYFNLS